jgi:hypothetical protein
MILDVSDPARPVRLGGFASDGNPREVQVIGQLAYVADGSAGLTVFDVSNPSQPARVGGVRTADFAAGLQVVGRYAYVADYAGFAVVDVNDPARPLFVTNIITFDGTGCAFLT